MDVTLDDSAVDDVGETEDDSNDLVIDPEVIEGIVDALEVEDVEDTADVPALDEDVNSVDPVADDSVVDTVETPAVDGEEGNNDEPGVEME